MSGVLCRFLSMVLPLLLLTACSTVASHPGTVPAGTVPLVTFVFDDGNDTDFLLAKKIFSEQGDVACSAVTTSFINSPYHLTPEQIVGLQNAGWEIMSHTVSHPNLSSLSEPQLEVELSQSRAQLEKIGAKVDNIVYPYNKNNELVRAVASRYYRSGRGGMNAFNVGRIDPYLLKSFTMKHDLPLMISYIDRAYSEKAWLIFYLHEIDAKLKLDEENGKFKRGEIVTLKPSGTVARYTTRHWFPIFGSYIYLVPFSGVPQPGDVVTGSESGATAHVDYVMYNDLTQLSEMLRYIHTTYKDMKVVTIEQGLDLLGIAKK